MSVNNNVGLLHQIGISLDLTWHQIQAFEPLTLGLLKVASESENWGHTIRKGAFLTVPLDHLIKIIAIPFIETFNHFNDIINEKDLLTAGVKIVATPIWWPIKAALKTALFVPMFLTNLKFPFKRLKEIFKYEKPSSSYEQTLDKLQTTFASSNQSTKPENSWESKFNVRGNRMSTGFCKPIIEAFEKFYPNSQINKVMIGAFFGKETEKELDCRNTCRYFFASDGYYTYTKDEVKDDSNVLLLLISSDLSPDVQEEIKDCTCPKYLMSVEDYLKLPYEMPEDLHNILKETVMQ